MSPTSKNIQKLKELTPNLPAFPSMIQGDGDFLKYELETGTTFAWNLLREDNLVSVARSFASNGTVFPMHKHGQKEWIICYSGHIVFTTEEGEKIVLKAGDSVFFPHEAIHGAKYLEDSWCIAVTVPDSPELPK